MPHPKNTVLLFTEIREKQTKLWTSAQFVNKTEVYLPYSKMFVIQQECCSLVFGSVTQSNC